MEDSVSNGVKSLELDDLSESFIDITDEFFKSTETIEVGDVVKNKYFALFEGTRALEVMNRVLDTGLIQLSSEELQFDVKAPQNVTTVLCITTQLFRSLMTWLNTSSLPITVLSCRYVEESLNNFDGQNLKSCNFGIERSDFRTEIEFLLVHKVLLSIVHGVLVFIKNTLLLGQAGVLYEEEDITTTTMGFDFLNEIPNYLVKDELQESISWVEKNIENQEKTHLLSFMNVLVSFSQICELLELEVNVFNDPIAKNPSFLRSSLDELTKIETNMDYFKKLPELPLGCFSEGIQKRNDNFLPPRTKDMDSIELAVNSSINMINDLRNMLHITESKTITELTDFVESFMNKRDPPSHVISRAMLQLFLVRDDRSVMGCPTKKFIGLLVDDMSSLTCYDSKVFLQFHQGGLPELNQELLELLNNIESAYYSYILSVSQNPCRQRQHFNRSILIWDTLQVQSESFELQLQGKYNVNDSFKMGDNPEEIPTMPISSWIFYQKLRSMLEVVTRGIELELYKQWELYSIYWYIEYLNSTLLNHFERVIYTLEYKKLMIANIPKKIKKLKAGEKKQLMKDIYKRKVEIDLPQLDGNVELIRSKMFDAQIVKDLSEINKQFFTVLYQLKMLKLPKLNKIPERLSYGLKMKSFQSVGVPEFPDYDKWCSLRDHFNESVKTKLQRIEVLENIRKECNDMKSRLVDERAKIAVQVGFAAREKVIKYDEMIKSCVGLSISATMILKQIKEDEECLRNGQVELVIQREGYHRYFPFFKISTDS